MNAEEETPRWDAMDYTPGGRGRCEDEDTEDEDEDAARMRMLRSLRSRFGATAPQFSGVTAPRTPGLSTPPTGVRKKLVDTGWLKLC